MEQDEGTELDYEDDMLDEAEASQADDRRVVSDSDQENDIASDEV